MEGAFSAAAILVIAFVAPSPLIGAAIGFVFFVVVFAVYAVRRGWF
jgi:hypothetical protein